MHQQLYYGKLTDYFNIVFNLANSEFSGGLHFSEISTTFFCKLGTDLSECAQAK